jgi:type II secretory pathway pseudopilin PulG
MPPRQSKTVSAFSLVECVVAMGIFAFVIVGIIGLFPAGMRRQADSIAETRAKIIAESIFSAMKASENLKNSKVPIEIGSPNLQFADYTQGKLIGFGQDGTGVNYVWPGTAINEWDTGSVPPNQDITTKARVLSSPHPTIPNLYQVTVDVGSPANLPAPARKVFTFSTLVYSPPAT